MRKLALLIIGILLSMLVIGCTSSQLNTQMDVDNTETSSEESESSTTVEQSTVADTQIVVDAEITENIDSEFIEEDEDFIEIGEMI